MWKLAKIRRTDGEYYEDGWQAQLSPTVLWPGLITPSTIPLIYPPGKKPIESPPEEPLEPTKPKGSKPSVKMVTETIQPVAAATPVFNSAAFLDVLVHTPTAIREIILHGNDEAIPGQIDGQDKTEMFYMRGWLRSPPEFAGEHGFKDFKKLKSLLKDDFTWTMSEETDTDGDGQVILSFLGRLPNPPIK